MRHLEVRCEDELNRLVLIRLTNDRTISVCLEERDACELVLVLRGYYRLATNQVLPVDQEELPPTIEDLAPPYLSLHKVIPEKWNYISQDQVQHVSFAIQPPYQMEGHTNGMYISTLRANNSNKTNLMNTLSLDRNMNSSMSNKNHRVPPKVKFEKCNSYDFQSVVSMEILEGNVVEAKNEEVLRRVQEMQQLVENSEKYLSEQNGKGEWQESSVDFESDNDSVLSSFDDVNSASKLKHSDSLLLLMQGAQPNELNVNNAYNSAVVDMLQSQSESDNDSLYTPHSSPSHNNHNNAQSNGNKNVRISFGLRSPDNSTHSNQIDLKQYLKQLKDQDTNISDVVFDFDPDIIDLTLLPPPATPDELDGGSGTPINIPPVSFADIDTSLLSSDLDLEEFLASVTVLPPTQQVTPAVELTPEEIMSYIIPPPPAVQSSLENLTLNEPTKQFESLPVTNHSNNGVKRRNSCCGTSSSKPVTNQVIEYATVDRKGTFSCCSKGRSDKSEETEVIQLPPRKSSDEKPPERPPKNIAESRQRSQSVSNPHLISNEPPPQLPPRGDIYHHAPPHIFLPPKKPPLPPVPPLEVLRSRKQVQQVQKNPQEIRTAGIGSPHLQRNRNVYNDIESGFGAAEDSGMDTLKRNHSTAVSTPTSPHLGKFNGQCYILQI